MTGCPIQALFWLEWDSNRAYPHPHALRPEAIPSIWADPFHHLQLLPPPAILFDRLQQEDLRGRPRTCKTQLRSLCLRIRHHAGARPSTAQRTTAANALRRVEIA